MREAVGRRDDADAARTTGRGWWLGEPLLVFAIALGVRLIQLGHVPHKDELNHVLAARALLESGTLEIVPGGAPYSRAWGFTYLVAGMFRAFGESLVVARLPAVVFGSALAALLFLWVRSEAGRTGAWFAALLLTFVPISIQLSQWVRFYTLHSLLFLAACLCVYRWFTVPRQDPLRTARLIGGGAVLLTLALHVQPVTVIGAAGLALWIALVAAPVAARRFRGRSQRLMLGVMASGVLLGVAALLFSDYGQGLIRMGTVAPLWAEGQAENVRYYHQLFLRRYGPLWTLFPLAALLALAARPRAASLAVCVFAVVLVTHSVLPWKQERYLYYALPFFFSTWGIAVGTFLPVIWTRLLGLTRGSGWRLLPAWSHKGVVAALLAGAAAFAAIGTPAVSYAHKMLTVRDGDWQFNWGTYRGEPDWDATVQHLRPYIEKSEVILASYDVSALHAMGRLDYLLSRRGRGSAEVPDFDTISKGLTPLVSTPEAVEAVMQCHDGGIALIERGHWRNPAVVTPAVVDFLESRASRLPLPEGWRMVAYHWPPPSQRSDLCQQGGPAALLRARSPAGLP